MVFDSRQVTILPTYPPLLDRARILQEWEAQADRIAAEIEENIDRYEQIQRATGVPRFFVAALHHMECSGSFNKHLANGDPISAATVNVPAGIPAGTWESCAIDIIRRKDLDDPDLDWEDRLKWVWRAEAWNGWGYRIYHPDVPTPYLWSGTSVGRPGKYVADGEWDAGAVSKQLGCVAIWQKLGVFNQRVAHMELQGSSAVETPVGVLKIGMKTWLKASTKPAKDLAPTDKCLVHPDQLYPIYDRLLDTAGHYHVKLKSGGALRDIYCYSLHGSIAMNEESELDEIGSELPEKETQVVSIDPTDKKLIQEHLIRIGLLDGQKGAADGKWGSLSESAWRAWCRVANISDYSISTEALERLADRVGYKDLELKPKNPSDKECVIATLCLKRMQELGMWLAVSMGSDSPSWNFWYLNGTNADGTFNKDSIDKMNDLRFLAQIGSDGRVSVGGCWVATWDAGWKYRKNRMNKNGCFQISYDLQFWSWRPGLHGSAAPHAALQQQDPSVGGDVLIGTRDNNENGRDSADKEFRDGGAVNHHGTPGRSPGEPIGPYSAGCGVGDNLNSHLNDFIPKIKNDRRSKASGGHLINCCFLDRSEVKGLPLVTIKWS